MAFPSFSDLLENQPIASAYLFLGGADWYMDRCWHLLCHRLVPPHARRFNGESLLAKDVTAAEVVEKLATVSMFGAKRLVRVKQVEVWKKEQLATILAYLTHPNPGACLVLQGAARKGSESLVAAVAKAGGKVLDFPVPSEGELPHWLQEQASARHKQLSLQGAALLVERAGPDLSRLEGELDKLCSYVGERSRIERGDVEEVVSRQRQFSVFELVRCVGKCQADRAVPILRQLLLLGEEPVSVLALLARHIRILWQVKDGLERGLMVEAIGQKLKLPGWILKKEYLPNVKLFSATSLFRAHRALETADLALKTTATPSDLLLEALLLSLCQPHEKGPGASAPEPGRPRFR